MKTILFKAAVLSAAILLAGGAPVHAQSVPAPDDGVPARAQSLPVPDGAVKLYLKDHQDLPMAAVDGVPRLTAKGDLWELGGDEAMQDLGQFQIVHHASGQCLVADTSRGGETAPVSLADCAGAHSWTIVYHNPGHKDFRFVAPGDYLLGLFERSDAVEGAKVLAIQEDPSDSMHFHEWFTEAGTEATPPPNEITPVADPPSGTASPSEAESPKPTLPTTGTGLGIGIGAGAVALAGGAALLLWWQRRRALRAEW